MGTGQKVAQYRLMKYFVLAALVTVQGFAAVPKAPITLCVDEVCSEPPTKAGIKWHPGHYLLPNMVHSAGNKLSPSVITDLADEPAIQGLQLKVNWALIEPTRGNYNFSELEAHLAQLEKIGKRYVLQVMDRNFGGSSAQGVLPPYLATEPGGNGGWHVKRRNNVDKGVQARIWVPAVMDRVIALHRALAARFDQEPYFEGIVLSESEVGFTPAEAPSDFEPDNLRDQYVRLYQELPKVWKKTNVFTFINYFQTHERTRALIETAYQNRLALGGPDIKVSESSLSWAQNVLIGKRWSGSAWVSGGKDYRGKMAVGFAQQVLDPSGIQATPSLVYAAAVKSNPWSFASSHVFWTKHHNTTFVQDWGTGALPFLRLNPDTVRTCPQNYSSCIH